MKNTKMLVLTDHNTHGHGESIYDLLKTMQNLKESSSIYIASRGIERNNAFFSDFDTPSVYAKKVDSTFSYTADGSWFHDSKSIIISEFDVLFLRLDRPLTDNQLRIIGRNFKGMTILNDPEGIIETGSKRFLLNFPEICPGLALCHTKEDVLRELEKYSIVLKPLHGYGGSGIIRLDKNNMYLEDKTYSSDQGIEIVETYLQTSGALMSMRFLKNVTHGDKRVVVVGGDVLGATLRLPAQGSWLCNLKQGGTASYAEVDKREYEIAETISPIMRKNGVIIFGFDTLEDDDGIRCLSEINTLNVGGFLQAQQFSGRPVIQQASERIWEYILERRAFNLQHSRHV